MRSHLESGDTVVIGTNPTLFNHGERTYVGVVVGNMEARCYPTALMPHRVVEAIQKGSVSEVEVVIDGLRTVGMRATSSSGVK